MEVDDTKIFLTKKLDLRVCLIYCSLTLPSKNEECRLLLCESRKSDICLKQVSLPVKVNQGQTKESFVSCGTVGFLSQVQRQILQRILHLPTFDSSWLHGNDVTIRVDEGIHEPAFDRYVHPRRSILEEVRSLHCKS
jgi:hypothetical protein